MEQHAVNASVVHDYLVEKNAVGFKNGVGLYFHGEQTVLPNPDVSVVIGEAHETSKLESRIVIADETVDRCLLALYSEGQKILDEGIVRSYTKIDVLYVKGYDFARRRGGPMYYAEYWGKMMMESTGCMM